MVDAVKGKFTKSAPGNRVVVFLAVTGALVLSALPLMNKRVYETEQKMAELRDARYDPQEAKSQARNQRLSIKRRPLEE